MAILSSIGWGKQITSVQELARESLDEVPQRYVADYPAAHLCDPSLQVPLIDMACLQASGESEKPELHKLYSACTEWGAFQLINHGVSEELIKQMKRQTREFYDLPVQEKMRYAHKENSLEGYGRAFVANQQAQWSDMMFVNALPEENRDLNFWPENPEGFRETIDNYTKAMRQLAVSLLGFMGMAAGVGAGEFSEVCEDGEIRFRMNYYPPCSQPERVIGSSPHTDITSVTFLLEFDDTPGLQVLKDGYWATVKPVPGAIDVIVGNIIQIMSNGIYKAPKHRAVVNDSKVRISIICFCYPNKNAVIQPAEELVKPEYPAIYKAISQPEYFRGYYSRKPGGIPFIDTLRVDEP